MKLFESELLSQYDTKVGQPLWMPAIEIPNLYGFDDNWVSISEIGGSTKKYVAISEDGYISTSNDGLNWTNRTKIANLGENNWRSVQKFSSSSVSTRLIALSRDGYISTSTNGTIWTHYTYIEQLGQYQRNWVSLATNYSILVAISDTGYVSTSTNGTDWNWASQNILTTFYNMGSLTGITYSFAIGKFIVLSSKGRIATSTDGIDWEVLTNVDLGDNNWTTISYDGSKLIALSNDGYVSTSTDGETWVKPYKNNNIFNENGKYKWVFLYTDSSSWRRKNSILLGQKGYISIVYRSYK